MFALSSAGLRTACPKTGDGRTKDLRVRGTIALFVGSLEGGGAERAMLDIGRGLAQRGFVVDLVLMRATGPYLEDVPDSVRVVALNARRPLATLLALARYLFRRRPDLLLSTLTSCNVAALLARVSSSPDACG